MMSLLLNAKLSLLASMRPILFRAETRDPWLQNARNLLAVLPAFAVYLQALRFTTFVGATALILLLIGLHITIGYVIRFAYTAHALHKIARFQTIAPVDVKHMVEDVRLSPLIALTITALLGAKWLLAATSSRELYTCVLFFTFTEMASLVLSSHKTDLHLVAYSSVAQAIYGLPLLAVLSLSR